METDMEIAEKLLIAIMGAVVGVTLNWLFGRRKAKREEASDMRASAIAYLEAVCVALNGMILDFIDRRVPHRSGRTFVGILDVFKPYVGKHLTSDTEQHIHQLRNLAEDAKAIDDEFYGGQFPAEEITRWVTSAERVIGDLNAEIAKLKGLQ
jgi:hypothetical protein